MALQANNNAVNFRKNYMANTITEQLPTVIQSHFQAHNTNKDIVNKNK